MGGSDTNQFVLGSSDLTESWWPMIRCLVLLRSSSRARAVICRGWRALLRGSRRAVLHLTCRCLPGAPDIIPSATATLCTAGCADRMAPRQRSWPRSLELLQSLLFSGPCSELAAFWSLSKWAWLAQPNEEYVASKIQDTHKPMDLVLCCRRALIKQGTYSSPCKGSLNMSHVTEPLEITLS